MIDPNNIPTGFGWLNNIGYAAFASIGGLIGYMLRTVQTPDETLSFARAAIECAAAGFVGLLVFLFCQASSFDLEWTAVIVGISGWQASSTVKILERAVLRRLGIRNEIVNGNDTGIGKD